MKEWSIESTAQYERDYKHFKKKRPNELSAMLNNLDTYFEYLNKYGNSLQVYVGFIYPEPDGIKAIDQKGGAQKVKL